MATSLDEIFGCGPDPRPVHLPRFLAAIRAPASDNWRLVAEAMSGAVALVMRDERHGEKRRDTRERLEEVAKLARGLVKLTDREEVQAALSILGGRRDGTPCDVTGYEYLVELAERSERAAKRITPGAGERRLDADLGRPTARRLCAAMVHGAMHLINGKAPGERNPEALVACAALWAAAGGDDSERADVEGAWVRHLRDVKAALDAATLSARLTAGDCLALLQQDRGR